MNEKTIPSFDRYIEELEKSIHEQDPRVILLIELEASVLTDHLHMTIKRCDRLKLGQYITEAVAAVADTADPPPDRTYMKIAMCNMYFEGTEDELYAPSDEEVDSYKQAISALELPRGALSQPWRNSKFHRSFPDWISYHHSPVLEPQVVRERLCNYSIGVGWNYFPRSLTTVGIATVDYNNDKESIMDFWYNVLGYRELIFHPYVLGLSYVRSLIDNVTQGLRGSKQSIEIAQIDSGFHVFRSRTTGVTAKDLDLAKVSAGVSGDGINLADDELMLQSLQDLTLYIKERSARWSNESIAPQGIVEHARSVVEEECAYIVSSCKYYIQDVQIWQKKAAVVIQGLFNLIAQRDNQTNIAIARDSKILAEQSQRIAEESKKDTTSMEAIAAVTMFFLPATFVASFFDMPLFEMDSQTNRLTTHHMWLYWTITIPLTIATMLTWLLWNWLSAKKRQSQRRAELEAKKEAGYEMT